MDLTPCRRQAGRLNWLQLKPGLAAIGILSVLALLATCWDEPREEVSREQLLSILQEGLEAHDPVLRAEAVRIASLAQVEEIWDAIRQRLTDPELIVRASAVAALLEWSPGELEGRITGLVTARDLQARQVMIQLLLDIGTDQVRRATIQAALADPEAESRHLVLQYLLSHPTETDAVSPDLVRQVMLAQDAPLLAEAVQILRQWNQPDALDTVHAALVSEELEARLRALQVLARVGSLNAWPYLRWVLDHGNETERLWARLALAAVGDRSVLPAVIEMLRTGEPEFLPDVLRALVHLPGEEVPRLLEDFRHHSSPQVRQAAIEGLIALGYPTAGLLDLLGDAHPDVVRLASATLARLPSRVLAEQLCASLRVVGDPVPLLRFLWAHRDTPPLTEVVRTCTPQLEALLRRDDPQVRGLSGRLYFATVPLETVPVDPGMLDQVELAYAFLEESVLQQPARFDDLYRQFLNHELLALRLVASAGLLRAGP